MEKEMLMGRDLWWTIHRLAVKQWVEVIVVLAEALDAVFRQRWSCGLDWGSRRHPGDRAGSALTQVRHRRLGQGLRGWLKH